MGITNLSYPLWIYNLYAFWQKDSGTFSQNNGNKPLNHLTDFDEIYNTGRSLY